MSLSVNELIVITRLEKIAQSDFMAAPLAKHLVEMMKKDPDEDFTQIVEDYLLLLSSVHAMLTNNSYKKMLTNDWTAGMPSS